MALADLELGMQIRLVWSSQVLGLQVCTIIPGLHVKDFGIGVAECE